ncbi:MAG: hypothetical protein ACXU8U_10950, partial [Asticcacaulis sp.]
LNSLAALSAPSGISIQGDVFCKALQNFALPNFNNSEKCGVEVTHAEGFEVLFYALSREWARNAFDE